MGICQSSNAFLCPSKDRKTSVKTQGPPCERTDKQTLLRNKEAPAYQEGLIPKSLEERNKNPLELVKPAPCTDKLETKINSEEQKQSLDGPGKTTSAVSKPQTNPNTQRINNAAPDLSVLTSSYLPKSRLPELQSLDFQCHLVEQKYGKMAYSLHSTLEILYKCTYYKFSKAQNSSLRLIEHVHDPIDIFTASNCERDIGKLLQHLYIQQYRLKLDYLYEIYNRVQTTRPQFLPHQAKEKLKKALFSHILTFDKLSEFGKKNFQGENILKFTSPTYDPLYHCLAQFNENFLLDFISNLKPSSFDEVLTPIFLIIIRECNNLSINDAQKLITAQRLLEALLQTDKKVIDFFVNHELFIPKIERLDGAYFQKFTLFGAFLSLTTFTDENQLGNTIVTGELEIMNPDPKIKMLRDRIHTAVNGVHKMMEYMIKCDQKYKQNILDWFYQALVLNEAKRKAFNVGNKVSSKGWFTNYLLLLLRFSQRFLSDTDQYPSWCTRIQIEFFQERQLFKDYLLLNNRQNIYAPSEIQTEEQKDERIDRLEENNKKPLSKYTFITKLVFFASHALLLHANTNKSYLELLEKIVALTEEIKQDSQHTPELIIMYANKLYHDVQLNDPYLYEQIYKFLTFQVLLILQSFDVPINDISDTDSMFGKTAHIRRENFESKISLPFYWIENLHEYLLYFRRIEPTLLLKSTRNSEILMNFILSVIRNPNWIANPHLKVQYLEFLGSMLPRKVTKTLQKDEDLENLGFLFEKNQYYNNYLIEGLANVFVEVEKTRSGLLSADKFGCRLTCCSIMNYLLKTTSPSNKNFRVVENLNRLTKESPDLYAKFIVLYLNDIIQLLDENLAKLQEIKAFQNNRVNQNQNLLFNIDHEVDKAVSFKLNTVLKSYYEMAACITKVSPDFFLSSEIKDKFITNLNYSFQQLNGDKATTFKLINQDDLTFDPRFLLGVLVRIYLNFLDKKEFIKGVVKDERNFDIQTFHKTITTLKKHSMLTSSENNAFWDLIAQLEIEIEEKAQEDKFIGEIDDIPEEFLDPVMGEIMQDPVLVPTSNIIMERAVIMRHLLNYNTDPFNRAKLTKEMLIPQPEFKKKIEDFFKEKRSNKK